MSRFSQAHSFMFKFPPGILLAAILFFLPVFILGCDDSDGDDSYDDSDDDSDGDDSDDDDSGDDDADDDSTDDDSNNQPMDPQGYTPDHFNPGVSEGYYYPIDYEFNGEILVVLFSDLDGSHAGVGEFERSKDSWRLIHWLFSNWIENGLTFPHSIDLTKKGYLISDSQANRAIEVDRWGNLLFSYEALYPNEAEDIPEGFIISWTDMAGQGGCGVDIVTRAGQRIWRFDSAVDLEGPAAQIHNGSLLPNGNVLMAICPDMGGAGGNGFALEVNRNKKEVWRFQDEFLIWPRNARRLENGNTLIAHGKGIWEVEPDGDIAWTFESSDAVFNALRLEDGVTVANRHGSIIWISPEGQVIDTFLFQGNENFR